MFSAFVLEVLYFSFISEVVFQIQYSRLAILSCTLNISNQSLLSQNVSSEKSTDILWEFPCNWWVAFLLLLSRLFPCVWPFDYDVSQNGPLWVHLHWCIWRFWNIYVHFLTQIWKVFSPIFSLFSCWDLHSTYIDLLNDIQ